MKPVYALLAGLTAHAAAWDYAAQPYTTPQFANNECSDKQSHGFDWSELKDGESNFQYGGDFDFSGGWKCSNSFGKREVFAARTMQTKAITNTCTKKKAAPFGSTKKPHGFSISTLDLSSDYDAEVDLHYTLVDGSVCKQNAVPCKKAGSTIKNSQCGGAKKVDIYLGSEYRAAYGKQSELKIGIHNIAFDCNPAQTYSQPAVPTSANTPPAYGYAADPYASPSACYGDNCGQQAASSSTRAQSSLVVSSSVSKYCNEGYGQGCASTTVSSIAAPAVPSSSALTSMSSSKDSSTMKTSRTVAASSVMTVSSSSWTSKASSSSHPVVKVGDVLPTCMNTWLQITTTDCKDNTAADCYCKKSKFTKSVIDCVQAWSQTEEETKNNLRYLVGICAQYVPENPSLIADCPQGTFNSPIIPAGGNNGTTTKAAASTPATSGTPAAYNPVAIIFYDSTSIAVPAIHFSIGAPAPGATPSAIVGLVVGAGPPQVSATPTPVASLAPGTSGPPKSMSTGTGAQFTGAAALFGVQARHVVAGAALVLFAL